MKHNHTNIAINIFIITMDFVDWYQLCSSTESFNIFQLIILILWLTACMFYLILTTQQPRFQPQQAAVLNQLW